MNYIILSVTDKGINDPNFLWVLAAQIIAGALAVTAGGWAIYILLGKIFPSINLMVKIFLTIIIATIVLSIVGLITDQLDG